MKLLVFFSAILLLLVACSTDSDPAPKCSTKAITYQEFKDNQQIQQREIVESVQSYDRK